MCALIGPEVFDQDPEDGRVVLLDPTPPPDRHEAAREAIEACPCGAISEDIGLS
jgi:ferredoxin